jgi:hypothetical protein
MSVYRKKLCQLRCSGMTRKKTAMNTLSSLQQEKWKTKSKYISGYNFQDAVMHLGALIISTPAPAESYTSKYETIEQK